MTGPASTFTAVVVVLAFVVVPLALRARFCWLKPRWTRLTWEGRGRLASLLQLALTAGQEIFVALEVAWLVIALVRVTGRQMWLAGLLLGLVSTGLHLYLLVDDLLLRNALFRLRRYFAAHARHWSLYAKSAESMGLTPLKLLGLALACGAASTGVSLWACLRFGPPAPSGGLGVATLAALGLAWGSLRVLPRAAIFRVGNILFLEQHDWATEQWERLKRDQLRAPEVSRWISGERFTALDATRPLWRRTEAFEGESVIDLNLADDAPAHVLLLFLESFRAANVGVIGRDVAASPEFDRLAREGVVFTQFYANGVQTTRAVTASLFGILPRFTFAPEQSDIAHLPRLCGVPQLFAALGYRNAFLHNGDVTYENQDQFFSRAGYAELVGMEEIQRAFPEARNLSGWGVPDAFLMRYYADWLVAQERQQRRTCATLFTISNHHPYLLPEGFAAPRFECPGNEIKEQFLRTFYYSDFCLGLLVRLLKERGLYERMLLVVLGDTGQPLGEHWLNFSQQAYLYEENLHVPLLLLAPGRLRRPGVIREPASQMDLLPTFIDLFGKPFNHHSFGASLLRRGADRKVFFNNPYGGCTYGQRRGKFKYLYDYSSGEASLFDLETDPDETENVLDAHASLAAEMHAEVDGVTRLFNYLYRKDRFC
jgi:hypothetical protein